MSTLLTNNNTYWEYNFAQDNIYFRDTNCNYWINESQSPLQQVGTFENTTGNPHRSGEAMFEKISKKEGINVCY
jgi:hypothetical protein